MIADMVSIGLVSAFVLVAVIGHGLVFKALMTRKPNN
jgi:hypothetical protein